MDRQTYDQWLLPLPGVSTDVKWGADLCYLVGDKMFAVTGMDGGKISCKVEPERFLELTDQPGIIPAPYLARAQWVLLETPDAYPAAFVRERLVRSYELIRAKLPKALQRKLGA